MMCSSDVLFFQTLAGHAVDEPGSNNYVPYANRDSSYLHWCSDGRYVCICTHKCMAVVNSAIA